MRYLFHDTAYKGKIIRYVKPPGIDSDGPKVAPNIQEIQVLSQYIEYREPDTIVIALLGRKIVGCSNEDPTRGPILAAFQREHKRLPDSRYKWKTAELVID
jgi:hypothetical protein